MTNNIDVSSPTPEALVALADYQKGSIVSKKVIQKDTGAVTFLAFDEGQALSEHKIPYDALVYGVDGEADITISGKTHRLKQGHMIILPANQPHAVHAVKKFKMLLIMIRS